MEEALALGFLEACSEKALHGRGQVLEKRKEHLGVRSGLCHEAAQGLGEGLGGSRQDALQQEQAAPAPK